MEFEREIPVTYKNHGLYVGEIKIASVENDNIVYENGSIDILTDFFEDGFSNIPENTTYKIELFIDTDEEEFHSDSDVDCRGDEYSCLKIESFKVYLETFDITEYLPKEILDDIGERLEEKEMQNYTPIKIGTHRTIP